MGTRRDFYRVLHVQPDAPAELIRSSYRTLMQALKMHPDLGGDNAEAALINEAFATLRDPDKRAAYDRQLAGEWEPAPTTARARGTEPARPTPGTMKELGRIRAACSYCGETHAPQDALRPDAVCFRCESPIFPAVKQPRTANGTGRALDRMPRVMAIRIRLAPPQNLAFDATTEDISINGARFTSATPLLPGQRLRLDCQFLVAVGVVRHVQETAGAVPPQWQIGVEFATLQIKQPRGVFVSTHA